MSGNTAPFDDRVAVWAVRYCLGRMTYVSGECAEWVVRHWAQLSDETRNVIRRDVDEAFEADDKARACGAQIKPLGWDCDRREWERVRALWRSACLPSGTFVTHNRHMMTRDQLAKLLATVRVADVARESGVSTKTIYRLRHKQNAPTLDTVAVIVAAVKRLKGKREAEAA